MNFNSSRAACVLLLALGTMGAPLLAQSKSPTAQELANLKLMMDWWREVVVSFHVEFAPKYMAPDFIQHNPNVPTGRDAFVKAFSRRPPRPIPDTLPDPPVRAFAKGDYVVLVWDHDEKDPADASKTYKYNTFDIARIQNNKIQEFWDSAMKNAPQPAKP